MPTSHAEIAEQDRWVSQYMAGHPGVTDGQARVAFWKSGPGAARTNTSHSTPGTNFIKRMADPDHAETFTEYVAKVLTQRAIDMQVSGRYGMLQKSIEQIRAQLWQTPDGRALRDLEREHGARPSAEVLGQIAKSGNHAEGFQALARFAKRLD